MPVIKQPLPVIPPVIDPHLGPGYHRYHPAKAIDVEPQTHNLTPDEFVDAVLDTAERVEGAGFYLPPSPVAYCGNRGRWLRLHLASLMGRWLVQRETVAHLLPHFWMYASAKVQEQPGFLAYIADVLSDEKRTITVWNALVRDSASDVRYHLTVQTCPAL